MSSPHDDDDAPLRPAAGHDVHFLERLSRADREQADVALRLYRSPEMVRAILSERGVPQAAVRVALAVAPGPAPAHVVVERSGHFVTCLGAGMRVVDTPVVGFDRVVVHLTRAERAGVQLEQAAEVLERKGRARALGKRLFTAGAGLTREEFRELSAVEPLVRRWVQVQVIRATARVWERRDQVEGLRGRGAVQSRVVRSYWEEYHSLGHLMLLAAQAGRPAIVEWLSQRVPGVTGHDQLFDAVVTSAFLDCRRPLTLRGLWLLARAGRDALSWAVRADTEVPTVVWASAKLAIPAVAYSHNKLRAECAGALAALAVPEEMMTVPQAHGIVAVLNREAERLRAYPAADPNLLDRYWRPIARTVFSDGAFKPDDGGAAAESLEGSASDLYATTFLNEPVALPDVDSLLPVLCACPILGRMPAEAFYFPAAHIDRAEPYDEEATRELAGWTTPPPPVRAAHKPGRNEPCPCGSGRKYKRCCGG